MLGMKLGAKSCANLGSGRRAHSRVATEKDLLALVGSVHTSRVQERRQREAFSKADSSAHDYILLKPEGFTRALAITTTICCAG